MSARKKKQTRCLTPTIGSPDHDYFGIYLTSLESLNKDSNSPAYDRSVALLLHDGLRFTPQPLTADQRDDLMWGLRAIALGDVDDWFERDLFKRMLDHGWTTTAPFRGVPS